MIECIFDDLEDRKENEKLIKLTKKFEDEYLIKTKGNREIFAKNNDYNIHIYPGQNSLIEEIIPKKDRPAWVYSIRSTGVSIRIQDQLYKISYNPVIDER